MSPDVTSAISENTDRAITASLFIVIVLITVGITFWASRQNAGTADYYAAGRSFTGAQNGMAVAGDYMSAASFLGRDSSRRLRRLPLLHRFPGRLAGRSPVGR
jgi:cation/acetate symporter